MFWNEESNTKQEYVIPDDIVDVMFSLKGKTLPIEHAHALSAALHKALPWLEEEDTAGIHLIHVAESGNGWMRPEDPDNEVLCLSRRTKMTLRLPKQRVDEASATLKDLTLDIDGHTLTVGDSTTKLFSTLPTMFARYVVTDETHDEMAFMQWAVEQLQQLQIPIKKMMAGRQNTFKHPQGPVYTRSLMIADLEPEQSVLLQQKGLGSHRKMGCGLFVPQKGITAVNKQD